MPRVTIKRCLYIALILASINLPVFYVWARLKGQEATVSRHKRNRPIDSLDIYHYDGARNSGEGSHREVTRTFKSLNESRVFMETHDLRYNVTRLVIKYDNFTRRLPKFLREAHKETFMKSKLNQWNLLPIEPKMLVGEIEVIRNGTFQMFYDCGFKSDASYFRKRRKRRTPNKSFDILVPLVIPMGYIFQHFYDGTLPKIAQAYPFLQQPNVKILLEKPYHSSIFDLLNQLQISRDRIVWHARSDSDTVYHAQYMVTTCVTPPLHPTLWKEGRRLLDIPDKLQLPHEEALVMYLTRAGASNPGRLAVNSEAIESYLRVRYRDKLMIFAGGYSLDEAKHIFSRVKIIIGTHGGAFYNMNFAPLDTTIIEFVPTLYDGEDIPSLPHAIFWAMADLLGQPYWRVPCASVNHQHDMEIDITTLNSILDQIDPWVVKP